MKKDQEEEENKVDDELGTELIEQTDRSTDLREAIDALPPKYREVVAKAIRVSSFSGPLPPPKMLGEYEKVLPGSADRIIKLAEDHAQHRRFWEIEVLKSVSLSITKNSRSQFVITLYALVSGTVLAYLGERPFSYALLVYALVGFANQLYGRYFSATPDD